MFGGYLFLYFILGLLFSASHHFGLYVFKGYKSPFEKVYEYILPDHDPPVLIKNILLGGIIAWTIRLILSTKIIPIFSGTLDSVIDNFFFKNLESSQKHNQLTGKNNFADRQRYLYKQKFGSPLTVTEFGKRLISYIEQIEGLKEDNYIALIRDVSALKENDDIRKAIRISLPLFSRTQVSSIILHDPESVVAPVNIKFFTPKVVFSGSLILVILMIIGMVYISRKNQVDSKNLEAADKGYQVEFTNDSTANVTLEDIYMNSNPELVNTLKELRYHLDSGEVMKSTIFLAAPSNEGKTTFINYAQKNILGKKILSINLEKLIDDDYPIEFSESNTVAVNEVGSDSIVFLARTHSLKAGFSALNLISALDSTFKEGFIIIDELDRLADKDVTKVISEFERFSKNSKGFICLIFVGLPEVFGDFLHNHQKSLDPSNYSLAKTKFRTFQDLKVRINAYKVTHDQRWDDNRVNSIATKIKNLITESPYLTYSIQNLIIANKIISEVADSSHFNSDLLKENIFSTLLDEAHDAYGRPNTADDEFGLYKSALMSIAVKYVNSNKGSFKLRTNEMHTFTYRGRTWSVNTMELLNRSGLIDVEHFQTDERMYHFFPFWVHEYLVAEHNKN